MTSHILWQEHESVNCFCVEAGCHIRCYQMPFLGGVDLYYRLYKHMNNMLNYRSY